MFDNQATAMKDMSDVLSELREIQLKKHKALPPSKIQLNIQTPKQPRI